MWKKTVKSFLNYFTKSELFLWGISMILISVSYILFGRDGILTLAASLIGGTSLIFNAKGHPFGQFLMVVFCILYGIISFTFSYYGEMISYLGMTAPMAMFSLISWIKHPYNGNKSEVEISRLKKTEVMMMLLLTTVITWIFYCILSAFHTPSLILSTLSITTSFLAVCLTFKRSIFYAVAYAVNDVILIVLWMMASITDISYLSVVICFIMFLANDIYGFINWSQMQKRQESTLEPPVDGSLNFN